MRGSQQIGVLVIATGRYARYLPQLIDDLGVRFLPGRERTLFVFSDGDVARGGASPGRAGLRVVTIPTPHEPWPFPTLKRYHRFCAASAQLARMDVLFYLDADARVVAPIDQEILPDAAHDLVAVEHPAFLGYYRGESRVERALHGLGIPGFAPRWVARRKRGSFERDPRSRAYVADHEGERYFMGGFNGGRSGAFLRMAAHLRAQIDADLSAGIVARWHDESHLNRYLIDHTPKVLSPSYGYPERWRLPYAPRILMLEKDHASMRAPLDSPAPSADSSRA